MLVKFVLDISMAVGGLLMFGEETRDELSSNILLTPGYPKIVSMLMVICIAIIPVTKLPLK
jgi:vesicular inhibitory amino acid transporter